MKFKEAVNVINNNKNFIIAGHVNPDGDCIGACITLALALNTLGKNVKIYLERFSNKYDYLNAEDMILNDINKNQSVEVFISLDCGDANRLGEAVYYLENVKVSINIDHHTSNTKFANYNYVYEYESSTCQIIYDLLKEMGIVLNKTMAEALFTGIVYDTGVFRHSNTTTKTHFISGELLKYNIRASEIINRLFYTRSYKATKMLGIALSNMELILDGKVSIATITTKELNEFDADTSELEGIIQFLNQVDCCEASIFLYEKGKNEIKVSLRSKRYLDVAELARKFNGGGHNRASGCTIYEDIYKAKEMIINELKKKDLI